MFLTAVSWLRWQSGAVVSWLERPIPDWVAIVLFWTGAFSFVLFAAIAFRKMYRAWRLDPTTEDALDAEARIVRRLMEEAGARLSRIMYLSNARAEALKELSLTATYATELANLSQEQADAVRHAIGEEARRGERAGIRREWLFFLAGAAIGVLSGPIAKWLGLS